MNSISQLPDDMICKILSLLSTKEAVQTSVLSTRWRHLWLWLPSLELNTSRDFSDLTTFMSFGDRFFDSDRASCIHQLKLSLGRIERNVDDESYFTSWIDAAIKRKIQYLHCTGEFDLLGLLFSCETLVYLSLSDVILNDALSVVLPCLKTMHLHEIVYRKDTLKKLISSCPVLENVKIVLSDADSEYFWVHSRSLKRLTIDRDNCYVRALSHVPEVVIDAPLLCYLRISDVISESFIVNNLESSCNLDILLYFGLNAHTFRRGVSSRRSEIRKFLLGISRVGNMTIYSHTFKIICQYSELEPLHQFCFMSRLRLPIWTINLRWLVTFLESCPNLKTLILEHGGNYNEMNQISFSSVPECLLSSLEFVTCYFSVLRNCVEMELVKYFLKNSTVLKKLTIRLSSHSTRDETLKELFEIPRASTSCEVDVSEW